MIKKAAQSLILLLVSAIHFWAQHENHAAPAATAAPIRLLETRGFAHKKVSTTSAEAQKYFDQGLTLMYAYNRWDAARSFKRAAELDPSLAMAWWGVAESTYTKSTGKPDYSEKIKVPREAIAKALTLKASPAERVYIEATAKLFSDAEKPDQKALDAEYATAMKRIYEDSPNDPDAATLYVFTMGWDWTKDGKPLGGTATTVEILERGLERNPKHLGLNHIYIHAVEASQQPERALRSADLLRSYKLSEPEMGHLIHMPAHIYMRVGDFQRSAESNEETARMINAQMSEEFKQGHFSHVFQFLRVSYYMQGNYAKTRSNYLATFDFAYPNPTADQMKFREKDLSSMLRFRRWKDILEFQLPEEPLTNMYYNRAFAYAATGRTAEAEAERKKYFVACKCGPGDPIREGMGEDSKRVGTINLNKLEAQIASANGEYDRALDLLRNAVTLEDQISYGEPPLMIEPVRVTLGGMLLRIGRFADAEKVFRDDLLRNRGNGRSLFGLMKALEAQDKSREAKSVERDFRKAWKYSDTVLTIADL